MHSMYQKYQACSCKVLLFIVIQLFIANSVFAGESKITFQKTDKQRIIILTDIENEPDDAQSMVRLMTYSNLFEIQGLIATTSCWLRDKIADWAIHEIVDAYGKVRENLVVHQDGYPTHAHLKSLIKKSIPVFGMQGVGKGKDSEGSEWLISVVDKQDNRPVWISIWGGANCLAQALWKVKETRSATELKEFVSRLRVYTISDQDDSGPWMRETFPDLFYIVTPGYEEDWGGAYHHATWTGISGDKFHGRFHGANFSIVDNPWLDENIRTNHGPLGAEHPHTEYLMEGDTPSFLYLLPLGLANPEQPNHGSWGGRYEHYTPAHKNYFYQAETRPIWTNANDEVYGMDGQRYSSNYATIWRWREGYQHDFAARIDWSNSASKTAVNHNPIAAFAGNSSNDIVNIKTKKGEKVELDATGSKDPDGDKISLRWFQYREAGTTPTGLEIENSDQLKARVDLENVKRNGTIHIILEVKDDGDPVLYDYRRIILDID